MGFPSIVIQRFKAAVSLLLKKKKKATPFRVMTKPDVRRANSNTDI